MIVLIIVILSYCLALPMAWPWPIEGTVVIRVCIVITLQICIVPLRSSLVYLQESPILSL